MMIGGGGWGDNADMDDDGNDSYDDDDDDNDILVWSQSEEQLSILQVDESMAMELKPDIQILEKTLTELKDLEKKIGEQSKHLSGTGLIPFQIISLCARQKDVNVCAQQENWQCERFACSRQKGTNDKTPRI